MSRLSEGAATGATARPSWTDREDQLGAGFQDLTCGSCGTAVKVRKMSPAQTSVQWPAGAGCPFLVRSEAGVPAEHCPQLQQEIRDAVEHGTIPVEPQ